LKNKVIKIIAPLFILYFFVATTFAQDKSSHEIGFVMGSSSFTTDYGKRNNFSANVGGNVGPGFGLVYYLNFTDYRYRWNQRSNYFQEHFRLRVELSYMQAELKHYGEWADKQSFKGEQLRAHTGNTWIINFGAQMEFHWVDIVDFGSRRIPDLKWSPYLSFGVWADYYDPTIETSMGDGKWEDPGVLFPTWDRYPTNEFPYQDDTRTNDNDGWTMSISAGIGTRHKLGEYSDILIESRWHYFFTDYIEGMNNKDAPQNKYNDWLLFIHVGYIYYLN